MSSSDEEELLFGGTTGEIESQMRQILRELQRVTESRQQKIFALKLLSLRDQLLSAPSRINETSAPFVDYEDSTGTFDGDVGQIERTLRLAVEHKRAALTDLQSASLQREIDACVELLRSPLVQSSGSQMIAYKRVWDYVRVGSLPALKTVDPLILRSVRDNASGHSLLHKAALLGSQIDLLNYLLDVAHCDINAVDHIGQTPLHVAVQVGNLPFAKRLMELKADVSIQDMARRTPLHAASRSTIDFLLGQSSTDESKTSIYAHFPNEWEISPQELERIECIGEGASGRVFSGLYKETAVAIKEVFNDSRSQQDEFRKEVEILTKIRHPNLVLFMGISTQSTLQIVTELCSGGSVHSYLHEDRRRFSPTQILRTCIDTVAGLVYLHSNDPQILHMDLKSQNLLLQFPPGENFLRVKIADFGISRVSNFIVNPTFAGTWWWMSPESLFGEDVTDKSDIYSFAMCMYEIMSGTMPYQDIPGIAEMPPVTVAIKVSGGLRPNMDLIPSEIKSSLPDLIHLMTKCWENDPTSRPSARDALKTLQSLISTIIPISQ